MTETRISSHVDTTATAAITVRVGRGSKIHAGYRDQNGELHALCGAGGMNVPRHRRSIISRTTGEISCVSCQPDTEAQTMTETRIAPKD